MKKPLSLSGLRVSSGGCTDVHGLLAAGGIVFFVFAVWAFFGDFIVIVLLSDEIGEVVVTEQADQSVTVLGCPVTRFICSCRSYSAIGRTGKPRSSASSYAMTKPCVG
jgi:hypothetical protein